MDFFINDKIYNNIYFTFAINPRASKNAQIKTTINSQDPNYRIYAIPVKLFENYTIAIDCDQGIEVFCGFYSTNLDTSSEAEKLAARTYQKINKTIFKQPFLYDKLSVANWLPEKDLSTDLNNQTKYLKQRTDTYTRWDVAKREKDLRLFIKVPVSCRSAVTILEGDFRCYNDAQYFAKEGKWYYRNNHSALNFNTTKNGDNVDLNNYTFKPISPLQLLAFNTGASYPFADRLVEYLTGSAITPLDEIHDNIKRVQKVMNKTGQYFAIEGLWENKMQNILYDYVMNSGPVTVVTVGNDPTDPANYGKVIENPSNYSYKTKQALKDKHEGYQQKLGHTQKSTLFDILGYVDKDVENWYASWKRENNAAKVGASLQSVDIYDGLYNI